MARAKARAPTVVSFHRRMDKTVGVPVELLCATRRAEQVFLSIMLACGGGLLWIDLHSADWVCFQMGCVLHAFPPRNHCDAKNTRRELRLGAPFCA